MEIIAETNEFIILNKAGNLITEKNKYEDSLEQQLEDYLAFQSKSIKTPYIGVVHRLDKVTKGLIVFAKKKSVLKELNLQIEKRTFKKQYRTIVEGEIQNSKQQLIHFLYKDLKQKKAIVVNSDYPKAKKAVLTYQIIEKINTESSLLIDLQTGRFHQIRAQLSAIGHPIIGDKKYGSKSDSKSIKLQSFYLGFHLNDTAFDFYLTSD